ncbi:hypothetical protein BT93_L4623 [Corymbia citriodora subsp. variegata]|uniref:Uncharacterized protein n=1 Tax=Corymbia citriodora subsp. variegata TaxID=360336 RepID=A0A8T0CFR0_CORYI|nr:hypothetical protein BT93_L4623 [Corymbia citriodora subsp. variegata]
MLNFQCGPWSQPCPLWPDICYLISLERKHTATRAAISVSTHTFLYVNSLHDIRRFSHSTSPPYYPVYLPAIGRFLIVVTFIEDALRIITQWNDQLMYLRDFRHIPRGITHLFLIFNIATMSTCSVLVIMRRYSEYAVVGLISVVVVQALGYGLIFDLNFFLRNLSVMGGLLMVLGDSAVKKSRAFAGLPSIDEKDKKMYIQLSGRVLLIFLFIGFVFAGEWGVGRVIVSLFGFLACVMVVVGFKAKLSAVLLVVLLSVFNILVNNFWTVSL